MNFYKTLTTSIAALLLVLFSGTNVNAAQKGKKNKARPHIENTKKPNSFASHYSCPQGPRGPRGPKGPRGLQGLHGPTGPAVALSGSFASFYSSTEQLQDLSADSSLFLQFDQSYASVGITPLNSENPSAIPLVIYDTFEISQEGMYLLTWSFNIAPVISASSGTKKVAITLYKNDTPLNPIPITNQTCVTTAFGQTTPILLTTYISGSLSIPLAPEDRIKLEIYGSVIGGTPSEPELVAKLSGSILTITQISNSA